MPRYWVIAPFESKPRKPFDRVWQFDLANNLISIGWSQLGDVSKMTKEDIFKAVASAYPGRAKGLIRNMLWAFYNEMGPGDFVIARRGQKILAAVGRVTKSAVYAPGKNPAAPHLNFLEVDWQEQPRDKVFFRLVFLQQTLTEISEDRYRELVEDSVLSDVIDISEPTEAIDRS